MPDNQAEKNQNYKAQDEAKIEQQFLEGTKDPNIGIYSNMFSAKSRFEGQDGGVVTALLVNGFEEHLFDAAVVVYRGRVQCKSCRNHECQGSYRRSGN